MIQLLWDILFSKTGFMSSSHLLIHLFKQLPFLKITPNSSFTKSSPKVPTARTPNKWNISFFTGYLSHCPSEVWCYSTNHPLKSKEMYYKIIQCSSISLFPPGIWGDFSQSPLQNTEFFSQSLLSRLWSLQKWLVENPFLLLVYCHFSFSCLRMNLAGLLQFQGNISSIRYFPILVYTKLEHEFERCWILLTFCGGWGRWGRITCEINSSSFKGSPFFAGQLIYMYNNICSAPCLHPSIWMSWLHLESNKRKKTHKSNWESKMVFIHLHLWQPYRDVLILFETTNV